jgi:hypothetical protein
MSTDYLSLSPLPVAACDTYEGMMADSLTQRLTRLEERTNNHIKFFWTVAAFSFSTWRDS